MREMPARSARLQSRAAFVQVIGGKITRSAHESSLFLIGLYFTSAKTGQFFRKRLQQNQKGLCRQCLAVSKSRLSNLFLFAVKHTGKGHEDCGRTCRTLPCAVANAAAVLAEIC
jgi:hypothetical protein